MENGDKIISALKKALERSLAWANGDNEAYDASTPRTWTQWSKFQDI